MLKICSTICRRWLPRSRFHLFQNMAVDTSTSSHILGLIPLLSSPLATIPLYVTSITIHYSEVRMQQDLWADELDNLTHLPNAFPFATLLTLFVGSWDLQGERIQWLLTSSNLNTSITHLCIHKSFFGRFPALAGMISQCLGLQRLSLNAVQYSLFISETLDIVSVKDYAAMRGSVDLPSSLNSRPSLELHTLQLDDFWCSHFLDWLVSFQPALPLHTVRISSIQWHEMPAIADFIQHFALSLDHLELQLDLPSSAGILDLHSCTYNVDGIFIKSIQFDDHGKFTWECTQTNGCTVVRGIIKHMQRLLSNK
jgi:hypothetical protein